MFKVINKNFNRQKVVCQCTFGLVVGLRVGGGVMGRMSLIISVVVAAWIMMLPSRSNYSSSSSFISSFSSFSSSRSFTLYVRPICNLNIIVGRIWVAFKVRLEIG
jgi:hypothetical protein